MSLIHTDYHKMRGSRPCMYACQFLDHELQIDGDIEKPEWQAVPFSSEFVDIEGDSRPRPYYRTRIKMRWSVEYWYFCAELEETQVWAELTKKNSVIFEDNDFEIFIDPDGDNINYYEFEMNALNTIWELNLPVPYKDRGSPINPYNLAGLKSSVRVQGHINDVRSLDRSWTLEVAIPWRSLKSFHNKIQALPRMRDYWRVNFSRVEWDMRIVGDSLQKLPGRAEHNWVWSPQGVTDMHRPEKWGFAYFVAEGQASLPQNLPPPEQLKELAMEVYYLQRYYQDKQGTYRELCGLKSGLSELAARALREVILLQGHNCSGGGFIAKLQDDSGNTVLVNDRSQLIF